VQTSGVVVHTPHFNDRLRLGQTQPVDKPAHNSPKISRETTGPVPGGARASYFSLSPLTTCVSRGRGRSPTVSADCSPPSTAALAATGSRQNTHVSFPRVERLFDDAALPTDITDGGTGFGLPEGRDDLLFQKLRPLHRPAPSVEDRQSHHHTPVLTCRRFRKRRHPSGTTLDTNLTLWLTLWISCHCDG
jgi:hypothetical protein